VTGVSPGSALPPVRHVAVCGDGQLGRAVAERLARRPDIVVHGPAARAAAEPLLRSGADLVLVATTTRLADVADDVRTAVESGSNVIVSAEESAYPWAVDEAAAREIDESARARGVTVLGGGVNPGLIFDALVLTLLGTTVEPTTLTVTRTVDISRFGPAVLRRLGVGVSPADFRAGVSAGSILGHAGFPQSMAIVADALGVPIDRVDREIAPLVADRPVPLPQLPVDAGASAGVRQTYVAFVAGEPWFTAVFTGHVDLAAAGLVARDEIAVRGPGTTLDCVLSPGIDAQRGSAAMVVNSVDRVIAAEPGWRTVAELPPAHVRLDPAAAGRRATARRAS
jgi:2,4-diaminopentanoate dehydrogenase